jgi:cysteine desulfurase / selenocysteine lyase
MSTLTPTGDGVAAGDGVATGDGVSAVPPWLPDEATLTRLANDLFAALPGDQAATARPGDQAASALPDDAWATVLPGDLPVTALPGDLPATSSAGLVAAGPEWPGQALALPGIGLPAAPSFYFVDELAPAVLPVPPFPASAGPAFDVEAVRRDFPILRERINGRQLVWLDNAATTQKPQAVIDRLGYFYSRENSNIHRAAHTLAARATDAYEGARSTVADFLGAPSGDTVVFTRGATEAINLVAQAWGRRYIGTGDEIVISHLEHHANIVPWQQLAEQTGAKLKVIPVDDDGQLLLDAYQDLLTDRTRLVAVAEVSNALGTIVPVRQVIEAAHRAGARVLIDGAQAVAHLPTDVRGLDADFYVFSGHKIFAPTGIGVLYGKPEVLEAMPPWQGGGNMIRCVTFERTSYQHPPGRFEAGTASIADAAALATALDYVQRVGLAPIARYEHELLGYATRQIQTVPGLRLVGTAPDKASILSFVLDGHRPEDVGSALDKEGIAVRAGHHCAQPILRRYGLESTVRPSLAMYNTRGEVDLLVAALHRLAASSAPAPAPAR